MQVRSDANGSIDALLPAEMAEKAEHVGVEKTRLDATSLMALAVLAERRNAAILPLLADKRPARRRHARRAARRIDHDATEMRMGR